MRAAGLEPDPRQAKLLRSEGQRDLLLCCRQSGKNTMATVMAVHEASFKPSSAG